jgi:hypothetical protein
LQQDGFNLAKAQLEYTRAQKQIASLNGPQMTRFVGLAGSVIKTMDEVRRVSQEMQLSGMTAWNRAKIETFIQTLGNTPNGKLAARYIGAVNTLKEEFANLANGGYAPTEPAWTLANQQINGNYGVDELGSSLDEVERLINYRVQGIPNMGTMGPGAANRYMGQTGEPQQFDNPGGTQSGPQSAPDKDGWRTLPNGNRIREVQ